MKTIPNYTHQVASHCESGSLRNLLHHSGLSLFEPMIFGLGSGPAFFYLFFAKGPSSFPLIGIRNQPGKIFKNIGQLLNIRMTFTSGKKTQQARQAVDELLAKGVPVAVWVDMFYMKYLPSFLRVHAPFHFILLVGKQGDYYAVSDPYFEKIGKLHADDLEAAWATHAPLTKDNFYATIEEIPQQLDIKGAAKKAIEATCKNMILPPVINRLFFFVGIQGMRTYAAKILEWSKTYHGAVLRDGMMFNAIGFEDQGTGGGAFRLMYGEFLHEIGDLYDSQKLHELATRMVEHGKCWRTASRQIVKTAKPIPIHDTDFDDWFSQNRTELENGLQEISRLFLERAEFEEGFFKELRQVAKELK